MLRLLSTRVIFQHRHLASVRPSTDGTKFVYLDATVFDFWTTIILASQNKYCDSEYAARIEKTSTKELAGGEEGSQTQACYTAKVRRGYR